MSRIYTHRDPDLANAEIPQLDLLSLLFGEFSPVPVILPLGRHILSEWLCLPSQTRT